MLSEDHPGPSLANLDLAAHLKTTKKRASRLQEDEMKTFRELNEERE